MAEGAHAPATRHIKPAYLIAGAIGALALLVGGLVLLTGGTDSPLIGGNSSPAPVPSFQFKVTETTTITTAKGADQSKAADAAKPAAATAQKAIQELYSNAFLVPNDWTKGTYDAAFAGFTGTARAQAMKQLDVLTAGTAAGDTYSDIQPGTASMKTSILIDSKGQPYSAIGAVTFTAIATKSDGTGATLIVSKGQYTLEKTGKGWRITAFSVDRADKAAKTTGDAGSDSASGGSS